MENRLAESIERVVRWVEERNYKGYEPADGNASPLRALTGGNTFLQRILQQAVLRAPINVRPLIGIRPLESSQARGYMASGYIAMYELTQEARYRDRAILCLEWLMQNKSPGYAQYSWGNSYPYATRSGKLPKLEPIIVWTVLNGFAFLDAYQVFGDVRYLEVASNICDWILHLPREKTSPGACISYHAFQQTSIHNSNMLGAAMLARAAKLANDSKGLDVAREAMLYSCSRQLPDGSWHYGASPKHRWVDNFHTGYNIDSLRCYLECSGDDGFEENLDRGFRFFKDNFFEADGRPKYYHDRLYPIDIQCAAQAIETLVNFADAPSPLHGERAGVAGDNVNTRPLSEGHPESLDLALKVARWTIDHMQDADGHFYYRDLGWTKVKTPLMHWGQATMFKALTILLTKVKARSGAICDPAGTC